VILTVLLAYFAGKFFNLYLNMMGLREDVRVEKTIGVKVEGFLYSN
jgi:hypothetical protein